MSDHLPECPCANRRDEFHEHDVATMVNGQLGCLACGVDCICPVLRACTVRVLGEVREAVESLPADLRASNDDGVGGMVVHADGTASQFSKPETFREYVERGRALATVDRLAQEAP